MGKTSIEWTDDTWNPIRGCSKVSPGCEHCYAMEIAARFSGPGLPYEGLAKRNPSNWTGEVRMIADKLLEPLSWRKPRRVFVNSTSDLFHGSLPDEWIDKIFAVMDLAPRHTFQVLTKRADRMASYLNRASTRVRTAQRKMFRGNQLRGRWTFQCGPTDDFPWPLPNVWLGVSVENRKHGLPRLGPLRAAPAATRFLSIEPLLEDIGDLDLTGIDWVIVGGESGKNARPMHPDWARSIRDQCQAAGVPFFFKQWGEWKPAILGFQLQMEILDGLLRQTPPLAEEHFRGSWCLYNFFASSFPMLNTQLKAKAVTVFKNITTNVEF